jgi:iron complex outermembrane receptor protein
VTQQKDCSGQQRSRGDTLELSCIPFEIPKHTFSVSGRYQVPLDESYGDVETSVTYAYLASRYTAQTSIPGDEPGARLPSFGLINASLSWNRIFTSNLDLQLYGTNLADKEYPINNSNQWHLTYFQSYIYSEPRIIGLNLSYHWGS